MNTASPPHDRVSPTHSGVDRVFPLHKGMNRVSPPYDRVSPTYKEYEPRISSNKRYDDDDAGYEPDLLCGEKCFHDQCERFLFTTMRRSGICRRYAVTLQTAKEYSEMSIKGARGTQFEEKRGGWST